MSWRLYKFEINNLYRPTLFGPGKSLFKDIASRQDNDTTDNDLIKDGSNLFGRLLKASKLLRLVDYHGRLHYIDMQKLDVSSSTQQMQPLFGFLPKTSYSSSHSSKLSNYFGNYRTSPLAKYPFCNSLLANNSSFTDMPDEARLLPEVFYYGTEAMAGSQDEFNGIIYGGDMPFGFSMYESDLRDASLDIDLTFLRDWLTLAIDTCKVWFLQFFRWLHQ